MSVNKSTEFIEKVKVSVDHPTLKSGRSNVFRPAQAWKWGQKSIKDEFQAMLEEAMDQKMEYDAAVSGSDLDAISDSDINTNTNITDIPDLESYNNMLSQFENVKSVSDVKHEHSKAFITKLHALHDKISVFISKVARELQNTQNHKLKESYQSACDFLADVQHELAVFDEDIAENENKLNDMERTIQRLQSKYEKAMIKLKSANFKQQDLKKDNYMLSMENSQLVLSTRNVTDTDNEDKRKVIRKKRKKDVTKQVNAYQRRLDQLDIDPKKHPYLYDDYEYDNSNACVTGFWYMFSKEIGFLWSNRNG